MIRCAIIDDEPLARECLVNYINEVSYLELVGQGANPLELNEIMAAETVDLVFLDIQMPVINGIDFLKITTNLPMVIITTAYPSFALEGFDLNVLDYLLKPITFNRFLKAVHKAQELQRLKGNEKTTEREVSQTEYFFLKCDGKYEKIYHHTILFVQGLQNYVTFYTTEGKYVSLITLKKVEERLPEHLFMRVHKSSLVAIQKIDSVQPHEISIGEHRIAVSRNYRKDVKERVLGSHLWKGNSE